jgi:hypothetical protein
MMTLSGNGSAESTARKTYSKPQLQVYGDLRQITNTATKYGKVADDAHPSNRTK